MEAIQEPTEFSRQKIADQKLQQKDYEE